MYLWKVNQLVDDFRSNRVTQKEEYKYMLLFTVLTVLTSDPLLYIDSSYNIYDSLTSIACLAVCVWGIHHCYKINSVGDNKDFILRIMCIGLPVGVRILVIFIPIFILGGFLEAFLVDMFTEDEPEPEVYETTVYLVATVVIALASYFVYLGKSIRAVSSSIT